MSDAGGFYRQGRTKACVPLFKVDEDRADLDKTAKNNGLVDGIRRKPSGISPSKTKPYIGRDGFIR